MLPFVVSGRILIALDFLLDNYSINPENFESNTPVAAFLKSIGGVAFGFMLPVLSDYIAYSIEDRPKLVVGFVGGTIANTGESVFLGELIIGFLVICLKNIFSGLPDSIDGIKLVLIYPLFGTFLIGIIMTFIIIPPVSALNTGITNFLNGLGTSSKLILGLVLRGMMAIDMGGPINKAAYVFGLAVVGHPIAYIGSILIGALVGMIILDILKKPLKN